jgi:hypothetical protein
MIIFYLLILIIIILLIIPHNGKESFIVSTFKENVLAKSDNLSKYLILH